MSNDELFRKVRELNLPVGKYALFGSAPLGIRGLRECHDIDIVAAEDLWDEFKKKGWEVRTLLNGSQGLRWDEIEMFKDWQPGQWDVPQLIAEAEMIDGSPFVRLERVLQWKRSYAREKDAKDIEIIEKFLRTRDETRNPS